MLGQHPLQFFEVIFTQLHIDAFGRSIRIWRRHAELCCQYLRKGSPIFIEGRLAMDTWEGQDGQKKTRIRVVADNFQFIGAPRGAGEAPPADVDEAPRSSGDYGAGYKAEPAYGKGAGRPAPAQAEPPQAVNDDFAPPKDDETPF